MPRGERTLAEAKHEKWPAPKLLPATEEPDFENEAEAAEWYDTHDTAQLPLEPVIDPPGAPAPPRISQTLSVRVSGRELEKLQERAQNLGLDCSTYVYLLINRHILDEPPLQ